MTSLDKEPEPETSLEDALGLADSSVWQNRQRAARSLAHYLDNEFAFETLVKLLDDSDTAVIETSMVSLTAAWGMRGLAEILKKLALSNDNVGYHIRDKLVALNLEGIPIADFCRGILSSEPGDLLREGALEIIQVLTCG